MNSKRKIANIYLLLICNILCAGQLFALDPHKRMTQYDIKVYTAKDGLPMNSLKKVFQDSRGYIWIGTQEGLVRFDGVEFKLYDKSNYPGLTCNFIMDIVEDSSGNLWLATQGGGISCFDGFKFTTYDTTNGMAHNIVNKIIIGKDGSIWCGTEEGVSHFQKGKFINYKSTASLLANNIQTMIEDQSGRIIFGTYEPWFNFIENDSIRTFRIVDSGVTALLEKKSGEILIGLFYGNLFTIKIDSLRPITLSPDKRECDVRALLEDRDSNLWLASEGGGIIRFAQGKFDSLTTKNGLLNNFILSIMEDKEGSLWFAGDGGLIHLKDNKFTTFGQSEGAPSNYCHSVCTDSTGNVCIGLRDAGISIVNQIHVQNLNDEIGLVNDVVLSVLPAHHGGFWIGCQISGLSLLSDDGKIKNYLIRGKLEQQQASALYETQMNELWIGASGYICKFYQNQFRQYWFDHRESARSNSTAIVQTQNGDIWIGTRGGGLFKIVDDRVTQNVVPIELLTDGITALYEDNEGVLWIGSDNHGLYRYQDSIYTNYSVRDGLFCDRLFSILEDDSAKLWFSTNKGVFSVRKQQFEDYDYQKISQINCQVYNQLDGMREAECNGRRQPSAWKGHDGKLYFTSIAGVVSIDPNHIHKNRVKPPVYIEQIASRDSTYRWQTNSIFLTAKERDIELKYTALCFAVPERVLFKYKLEGYDKDWVDAGTRRKAFYTNLSYGNYVFRVIACNNDGIWNEQGSSVQFIIPRFSWETWWARIGYIIIGSSILVLIMRRRYKRRYVEAQLKMEKEHASKLEELDKARSRFFAGISHEFRTPLTLIESPLQDFLTETKAKQQRSLIDMMLRNTHRLKRLVEQLLDLSQLQSEKLVLQARPVNLIPFLKNILAAFESYAKRENIRLTMEMERDRHPPEADDGHVLVYLDPEKMEKVFINLLSNAIKFTSSGGKVKLSVDSPDRTSVKIHVSDTGRGIPAAVLPHIFDYFYRYRDENNAKESGSGIGLALTKELVQLHYGEISVTSLEGVGTEFTVTLPLGKGHLKPEQIVSDKLAEFEIEGEDIREKLSDISDPFREHGAEGIPHRIEKKQASIQKLTEKPTILLVEDNPDMRSYIFKLLQSHFQIIEARDGQEGLNVALQEVPDLIISDIMMPQMDGFEMCQKLKINELTSHIPIILLTAKGSGEDKLRGLNLGAIEYLIKPFDKQELKLRINNLIQLQRQTQEQLRKQIVAIGSKILTVPITSADDKFIDRVMAIVEKRVTNPNFSPESLAREVGMSRAHLNRKLKGLLNQRTNDFIRTMRLKRAALLLEKKAGNVSEIAFEVGFNHLAYFARSFKNQYGVAPSEYMLR